VNPLTFGSGFAGCGGLDLGLKMAGMKQRWWLEIDNDARDVLAEREPNVGRWDNIKTFLRETASERRGSWGPQRTAIRQQRRAESAWVDRWNVDVVAGGFPCQDISYAGFGAGLSGKRSGLFYELMRVVRILRPRYVLLENVAALLTRGLDAVLGTLASYGYDCEWTCLQAADLGASHLRDRIFIVAHAKGRRSEPKLASSDNEQQGASEWLQRSRTGTGCRDSERSASERTEKSKRTSSEISQNMADAESIARNVQADAIQGVDPGLLGSLGAIRSPEVGRTSGYVSHSDRQSLAVGQIFGGDAKQELAALERSNRGPGGCWEFDPADVPESGMGRMVDGVSYRLHKGRARNKMLGNAVPPPVGEYLGRRIVQHYARTILENA
jgi:DNA (cytosine-5)-methyltransferase 1